MLLDLHANPQGHDPTKTETIMNRIASRAPRRRALLALALPALAAACAPITQQFEGAALSTAQRRAAFELNCPQATPQILSEKTVDGIRFQAAEYTIGVRGCGRQAVYLTYCRDASDCNAIAQTGRLQQVAP